MNTTIDVRLAHLVLFLAELLPCGSVAVEASVSTPPGGLVAPILVVTSFDHLRHLDPKTVRSRESRLPLQ